MSTVKKLSKPKLSNQVYGQILSQILSGTLMEGAKLPSEKTYCELFSVSRPIVRDALARLAVDGIVDTRQGSGSYLKHRPSKRLSDFAAPGDLPKLLECIEFRIELEGTSATLAAERRSSSQLEDIATAFDRLKAEAEADFITPESDMAFHLAIAAATGNTFYIDAMKMVHDTTVRLLRVSLGMTKTSTQTRIQQVIDEHTEIYEAIATRDPVLAQASMRLHLARSRQRITDRKLDVD